MQFGRERVSLPHRWPPGRLPVVLWLIFLIIGAYVLQLLVGQVRPGLVEMYGALTRQGLSEGYYWQFVSYLFLHGSLLHLLVNCMALYFAGREVETILGSKHFLAIFFLGGVAGGIAQLLAGPARIELVGASGGVCAMLLAFTTLLPELEITALIFFIIPLRMRAKWLGRAVILSSIAFAWFGLGQNIGHVAHLGGAMTGWFYARRLGYGGPFWFQRRLRERRRLRRRHEQMGPEEFISGEIDPILDKISREGIHSLTRAERRVLELGREKIAQKTSRGA